MNGYGKDLNKNDGYGKDINGNGWLWEDMKKNRWKLCKISKSVKDRT